ncbi:unnamed protein product, partial [Nesidiocoris tenuis]
MELKTVLVDLGDDMIVWLGDLNARTGTEQVLDEEFVEMSFVSANRKSKDKVCNRNGKLFLECLEEFGLVILNGRTRGDSEGELTFVSHLGSSTNDYVAVTAAMVDWGINLVVGNQIFSDHMPLEFTLRSGEQEMDALRSKKRHTLKWKEQFARRYRDKLSKLASEIQPEGMAEGELVSQLSIQIRNAVNALEGEDGKSKPGKVGVKPWFDWDCFRLRKEALGFLNMTRRTSSHFARSQYVAARKEYLQVIRRKKRDYYSRAAEELSAGARLSSADFWKKVKLFRKSGSMACVGVTMEQLQDHFYKLLNLASSVELIPEYHTLVEVPELDALFSIDELKAVLKKSKSGKAPGWDGIPYEFFVGAPDNFLGMLLKAFNGMYQGGRVPVDLNKSLLYPLKKKLIGSGIEN